MVLSAVVAASSFLSSCKKNSDVQSSAVVSKVETESPVGFTPDFHDQYSQGYHFRTVKVWNVIGSSSMFEDRIWTNTNVNATKYADGSDINYSEEGNAGRLYSYYDAFENHSQDNQGVCPAGYHIPDGSEWAWTAEMVKADAMCDPNDGGCLAYALRSTGWNGNDYSGLDIKKEKGHGGNLGENVTGFWFRDGALIIDENGTYWKSVDEAGKMANLSVRCVKN